MDNQEHTDSNILIELQDKLNSSQKDIDQDICYILNSFFWDLI